MKPVIYLVTYNWLSLVCVTSDHKAEGCFNLPLILPVMLSGWSEVRSNGVLINLSIIHHVSYVGDINGSVLEDTIR